MNERLIRIFCRAALSIYLGAAGAALLIGDWARDADPQQPIWLPFRSPRSLALIAGLVTVAIALLLWLGQSARQAAIAACVLIVLCLVVQLARRPLFDTATHCVPLLVAAVVAAGGVVPDARTLLARLYLGAVFTAQGLRDTVVVGPLRFAERVYVLPFAHSHLPRMLLWLLGVTNPFVQLVTGICLVIGLRTRAAAIAIALFLLTIFIGHVVEDPFDRGGDVHDFAMMNFAAALAIIALHRWGDRFSLDEVLTRLRRNVSLVAGAIVLLMTACSSGRAPKSAKHALSAPHPRLIVMIAVDQLRPDLLDRYDAVFTGGLRRLRDHGFRFTNTYVNHAPTTSLPGHTTLATGVNPAHHGIVAGGWPEYLGDGKFRGIDPALDDAEKIVGFPTLPGASPRRILASAIPEWVLKADGDSRVVAVGGGEYSSLLHAGHTHQSTYWFNAQAGQFVTSTYYAESYPAWVDTFNRNELPSLRDVEAWICSVPERYRSLALPDQEPFEFDGVHTQFPHRFADEAKAQGVAPEQAHAEWYTWTPQQDEATFALAEAAVENLALGQRGTSDYLSIVASSVDSVGHRYGPFSLETLDTLVRLDRDLDSLFKLLDARIGAGHWVLALSADHGVDDIPEHLRALGIPAKRLTPEELDAAMNAAFAVTRIPATAAEADAVKLALARFDFMGRVITPAELAAPSDGDPIVDLYRHSYRPDRVPVTLAGSHGSLARLGLDAAFAPHVIGDAPANHGSPYAWDRHVPLIFYGAGIQPGTSSRFVHTTDVAPTLAALGGVPVPPALDGHPLLASPGAMAYAAAEQSLSTPTRFNVLRAIRLAEEAEDTAAAHQLAARAHLDSERRAEVPHATALAAARRELARALILDPDDADVITLAAAVALNDDFDRPRARRLYERALAFNPTGVETWFDLASLDASEGKDPTPALERATESATPDERADIERATGRLLYETRRFAEVRTWADRTEKRGGRAAGIAAFYRGLAAEAEGNAAEGVRDHMAAVAALGGDVGAVAALARSHALAGETEVARQELRSLEQRWRHRRWVVKYQIATAYEALGDLDATFRWLDRAVNDGDDWLMWLMVDPRWDRLRHDSRFSALAKRAGFDSSIE